ncbi:MAG: AtpZ/AtpI family protein [Clostridia bacterium]|nr:AtpZ/AtpI family protein [Clostridia bacterium]
MRAVAFGLGIGVTMALLISLGVVLGRSVDAKLGTDPAFTVLGLLLGLGAGIYALIRQVGAIASDERRGGGTGGPPPPDAA